MSRASKTEHKLMERAQDLLGSEMIQGLGLWDRAHVLAFALGISLERAGAAASSKSSELIQAHVSAGRRSAQRISGPALCIAIRSSR
jgi:hypothetical protein